MSVDEIKKQLKTGKLLLGVNQTLKNLKLGKLEKVFVSSNCKQSVLDDINYYCSFSNTPVVQLGVPNTELGVVCRKQFSISVLGLLK